MCMGEGDHSDLRFAFSPFSAERSQHLGFGLIVSLVFLTLTLRLR